MPLAEVRLRYREVVRANKLLLVSIGVMYIVGELFFAADTRVFVQLAVVAPLYLRCCGALGRLARCFGQDSWTTAVSAFFFYPWELLLAWLAYGRGVRAALAADETSAS